MGRLRRADLVLRAVGAERKQPVKTEAGFVRSVCRPAGTVDSFPLSPFTSAATLSSMGARWWQFRKRKDERCAQAASQFFESARHNRHSLVTVIRPTQFARRGSKAIISVDGGPPCDAWFWWYRVAPGQVIAVDHLGQGWGPHTHRPGVTYIGSEAACGVHAWLTADVWARAQRHNTGGRIGREPVWVAPPRR